MPRRAITLISTTTSWVSILGGQKAAIFAQGGQFYFDEVGQYHSGANSEALEAAKPGLGLVNIGRAGLLDHDALVDLLKTGHLSGAILDVFASEPLPSSSPLWSAPNLIINPHVSSDDLDGYMRETMSLVCRNLRSALAGRRLSNVVDPARGY